MALYGTINTMALPDLLTWIRAGERTGSIAITRDRIAWNILTEQGRICGYQGPELDEQLGSILVTSGLLTEDDVRLAYQYRRQHHTTLMQALVQRGLLSEQTLQSCLQGIAIDAVYDLFLSNEGDFVYTDREERHGMSMEEATERVDLQMDINHVLMEAATRNDEWLHIRKRFPTDAIEVTLVPERLPWLDDLGIRERRLLASLTAGQHLADICLELMTPVASVLRLLVKFEEQGAVRLDVKQQSQQAGGVDRVNTLVGQAEVLRQAGQYEEAIVLLEVAVKLRPEGSDVLQRLDQVRDEQLSDLYNALPPFRVPYLRASQSRLDQLRARSAEQFLLSKLQQGEDIGHLVMMSPMGERETLRTLRKWLHGGIVGLR